jgi:DDE superfamily endonuclease
MYNIDETGVLLSILNSLKVLVGKNELKTYRGAGVKRTLITAIECISADGRYLHPLIIWPATTYRSTWTIHPTPGWHFGHSDSGYTNTAISLYWIKHVFDPLTKARAGTKPRILINDGFGTHESLELIKFCYKNNIILCCLLSHTSYKLQPCDVGVFGLLKIAYREEVERLYRRGSNMIGKQHFTLLYDRAQRKAMTSRNIISG